MLLCTKIAQFATQKSYWPTCTELHTRYSKDSNYSISAIRFYSKMGLTEGYLTTTSGKHLMLSPKYYSETNLQPIQTQWPSNPIARRKAKAISKSLKKVKTNDA